jgi:type II secretory pathway predicted ATPase ExeA
VAVTGKALARLMPNLVRRQQAPALVVQEHHRLPQRPFGQSLDQRFFYPSQSHVTARNEVRRALQQREGLVVVTGAPGTGKTLLCRTLLQELEPGACASIILDPRITIEDLLLHVLADFGVINSPGQIALAGAPTRHQLMRALQHFLASLIPVWGCAVLVIDEAQDLDPEMLEQLRLLLNFETDEAKLLQIVLVGHPELNRTLREHASQLDERVARRCELHPLSEAEIGPYIDHRLSMAHQLTRLSEVTILESDDGMCHPSLSGITFTKAAIGVIATQSRGIPRAINVLCDRALEIAEERGVSRIDWRIMRAASRRVHVRTARQPGFRPITKAAMAAAAVMLLAILGFGVRSWGTERLPKASPPPPFARLDSHLILSTSLNVKSLPAADSFNVRVASFRVAGSAAALAAQLQAGGLPAFVRVERGSVHQVIVGPYLSYGEIAGVQARLARYGHSGVDVFIESFDQSGDYRAGGLMARSPRFAR